MAKFNSIPNNAELLITFIKKHDEKISGKQENPGRSTFFSVPTLATRN